MALYKFIILILITIIIIINIPEYKRRFHYVTGHKVLITITRFNCKYKTFAFFGHIWGRVRVRVLSVLTPWGKLHPWSIGRNLRRKKKMIVRSNWSRKRKY